MNGSFITPKEKYIIPYDSLLHKVIDYDKEQNYAGKEGELFFAKKDKDGIETIALFVGTLSGKNIQLTDFRDYNAEDIQTTIKELEEYVIDNINAVNEKLSNIENGAEFSIVDKVGVREDSKIIIAIDGKKVIIDDSILVQLINAAQQKADEVGSEAEAVKLMVDKKVNQSSFDELSETVSNIDKALNNKAEIEDVEEALKSLNFDDKYVLIEDGKSLIDNNQIIKLNDISDGANKVEASSNGYIKIDGKDTIVYVHPDKHNIVDVENLQNILDTKQNVGNYADKIHSHSKNDISDFCHRHLVTEIEDFEKEVAKIEVEKANEATKAFQDGNGEIIADVYAKRNDTYTIAEVNEKIGAINNHSHDNKSLLDGITRTDKESFEKNTEARHTHKNKETLDKITEELIEKIANSGKSLYWQPNTHYYEGDYIINPELSSWYVIAFSSCAEEHTSSEEFDDVYWTGPVWCSISERAIRSYNLEDGYGNTYSVDSIIDNINSKSELPNVETTTSENTLTYKFVHNKITRVDGNANTIEFIFNDGSYPELCSAELNFNTGATAPMLVYPGTSIIQWVGTDCANDTYKDAEGIERYASIFQPSPDTHYGILFDFNGKCIVGIVNGYKLASSNTLPE